jgi:protein involved in polysaccharide export with SLBB domain
VFGFAIAVIALVLLITSPATLAQQPNISQELQLFNGMSPEQQQAILQQLSGGGATGNAGGLGSLLGGSSLSGINTLNASQQALLQQQQLQQQRRQRDLQSENGEVPGAPPVLKAGDSVLVDVSLPAAPPQDTSPNTSPNTSANNSQTPNQSNTQGTDTNGVPLNASQLAQLISQNGAFPQATQEGPQPTPEVLEAGERQRLQDLAELIRNHNPYRLDSNGELLLPGIPTIALAGLTEALATRRVAAEPAFEHLLVRLTRLPLDKIGQEALKPFGYDLFDNSEPAFSSELNVPVPADYIIGPGDILQVQLYGSQNLTVPLIVGRDGRIGFPQLGPIQVGGKRYSEVKADIEGRVARQLIGQRADVSMGETRTISVFVLGAAQYPGAYTVSGLATVTTALFAAGGVETTGSLRDIEVKRQGKVVRTLDLYDLLMRGDSSGDIKLQPGDIVFIPPVGPTVSLDGEVLRPAIYELKGDQSVSELLAMGGGLTPLANRDSAALVRIDPQQQRVVIDVNPTAPSAALMVLHNGDTLQVPRLGPQIDSGVTLQGYVYQPRNFAWHSGLRLTQVVSSVDDLKPNADQHYLLIRRELPPDRRISVLSADLNAALAAPGSAADVPLMPRDIITVFDLENSRQYVIQSLLEDLRLQANQSQPTPIVHIDGRVKVPGDYPLEPGMHVSDLIRAGGGLESSAYSGRAELSRYTIVNGDQRRTQILAIDLNAVRSGDATADVVLQPFDRLSVKEVSGWTEQAQVTLLGEVRFPGTYAIKQGETMRSVIERAGGLTNLAFPEGAVFTRVELKRQEQEQLDRYSQSMRISIAETALMGARAGLGGAQAAIGIGQTLLTQLQSTKAVGRLVINLQAAIRAKPGSSDDVILRDGDELIVPRLRQEIMVLGEVQDATSHLYHPGMTRDDYINQSGGVTRQADRRHTYVVRADGSVATGNRDWFQDGDNIRIRPGDAIVVPLNTQKLPPLTLWQSVTTILYNIAIAAAEANAVF